MNSTRRGHLKRASRSWQNVMSSRGQLVARDRAVLQLDHCEHLFAPLVVRHPDRGRVADRVVFEQHRVDLGGVDVHATRDDEVRAAVGEEEEAVLIEVPEVAEGEVVAPERRLGLGLVAVVLELPERRRPQPHLPHRVGWERVGVFVAHDHLLRRRGLADRPRLREPGVRVHDRARALGRRVVLPHDRAEPLDEPLLDRHRAGRGAMDDCEERRRVVLLAHVVGERQEPVEHRRHHVRVRDSVRLDELEAFALVPPLHEHDGRAPVQHDRERKCERRGVVQRSGAQVHHAGRVARELRLDHGLRRRCGWAVHPLRPAGGARRVEHHRSAHRILERRGIGGRERLRVRDRVGGRIGVTRLRAHDQPERSVGQCHRHRVEPGLDHHRLRAAVLDDVARFGAGQMPVDRRESEPAAVARGQGLDELGPVPAEQRDRIAGL